jgi:hypothetical protein
MSVLWMATLLLGMGIAVGLLISRKDRQVDLTESVEVGRTGSAELESKTNVSPSTVVPIGQELSPYAKDARIAELEMQLREKEFELSRRGSQIESLEQRVGELQKDAERYRAGLDEAVAELNQLRTEIDRLEGASRSGTSGTTMPQPALAVQPVGPPYVTISSMGFVTVSGFVNNPTRAAARGRLKVSLVGSAGVIETRDFPMYIPPNSQERYDITFPSVFPTERIAAQATWVP